MEIYITKEFASNFFTKCSISEKKFLYEDFKSFVKKLKSIKIIVDYDSKDDFNKDLKNDENAFWHLFLDISDISDISYKKFSELIENDKFYKDHPFPIKMFFISESKELCNSLIDSFGFEFISIYNFEEKWEFYYKYKDNSFFNITNTKTNNPQTEFSNFSKLKYLKHPFNCIIFRDRYLFNEMVKKIKKDKEDKNDNDDYDQQFHYKDNLFKIFDYLLPNKLLKFDLQILILTSQKYISIRNPNNPKKISKSIKLVYNIVDTYLKNNFPNLNYNLTIIDEPFKDIHDRFIITNYFCLKFTSGLNLFNPENKIIHKLSNIYWHFIYSDNSYFLETFELLKNYFLAARQKNKIINNIPFRLLEADYSMYYHSKPVQNTPVFVK